ncbi:MAG: hypothetical protein HY423_03640 [Candidatus Lambdaproteobacteria bacterium]|nr:hypothetical protein [Candidatus Lambdaproteobacteria bacterium]
MQEAGERTRSALTCRSRRPHRFRPPDAASTDLVRECGKPSCFAAFTSREAVISVIEDSADGHSLLDRAACRQTLSPAARAGLLKLIQAG